MTLLKKKLEYKWVIVAACFTMIFAGLGFCSGTKGIFLAPVTEALQIPRSMYAINDSLRFLSTAGLNLFFGALVMKFGPRKLIGCGLMMLVCSMLAYSFAENVYMIYLGGILLGAGLTFAGTTMVGYVVNIWCKESRGTVMGAILCANGLGSAVAAPVLTPIIYTDDPFSYRTAYRMIAITLFVVTLVIIAVFRDAPNKGEQLPQVSKKKAKGNIWTGISLKEALKKPYFYLGAVCVFMTGMILQGVNGVSSAHFKDVGHDPSFVAIVVSVHALSLAAFKFLVGVFYDKKGLRTTMLICDVAAVVMIGLLAAATTGPLGQGLALGYGIISSLALPLETIMLPLIATDLFGEKDYPKLLGILVSINTAGYALGAPLSNLCFDMFSNYRPIFLVYVGLMAAVAALFMVVLSMAKKQRERIRAQEAAS